MLLSAVSNEAFAVLTIENNRDWWASMGKKQEWKDLDVSSMYTTLRDKCKSQKQQRQDGNTSNSSKEDDIPQARRYRGWSAQGIVRYNQLFDEIKESRTQPLFLELGDYLMEDEEAGMGRNKCTKVEDKKPLPVARNELWIEDKPCSTVTTSSESIRLPPGLQDIGDDNIIMHSLRK
jgi:hypothetical protein